MRINKCVFCEKYKHVVEQGNFEEEKWGHTLHLRARLYVLITKRGGKTVSTNTYEPMKLRYCPSCGKELEKLDTRK